MKVYTFDINGKVPWMMRRVPGAPQHVTEPILDKDGQRQLDWDEMGRLKASCRVAEEKDIVPRWRHLLPEITVETFDDEEAAGVCLRLISPELPDGKVEL